MRQPRSRNRRGPSVNGVRGQFEALEERRVLAVTVEHSLLHWVPPEKLGPFGLFGSTPGYWKYGDEISGDNPVPGQLIIRSNSAADRIDVRESDGQVLVTGNIVRYQGQSVPQLEFGETVTVELKHTGSIVFIGGGGDDRFSSFSRLPVFAYGGGGNDLLWIASQGSRLYGEDDNDTLICLAAPGGCEAHGGYGNDTIHGSEFRDHLYGDYDQDTIYAHGGSDIVYGGESNDKLFGMGGEDWLYGEGGKDQLDGGGEGDYLDGGHAEIGLGNIPDDLTGGPGVDVFVEHITRDANKVEKHWVENYLDYTPQGDWLLPAIDAQPQFRPLLQLSLPSGIWGTDQGEDIHIGNYQGDPNRAAITISSDPAAVYVIHWADFSQGLDLYAGGGDDRFFVDELSAGQLLRLFGESGTDQFILGGPQHSLNSVRGRLVINGGGGTDSVQLYDQTSGNSTSVTAAGTTTVTNRPSFTITDQGIVRDNHYTEGFVGPFSGSGIATDYQTVIDLTADVERASIFGGNAGNSYNLNSVARAVYIAAGGGDDRLLIDPLAAAISDNVFFDGMAGVDTVDYSACGQDLTVNVGPFVNPGLGGHAGVERFVLGQGDDTVNVGDEYSPYSGMYLQIAIDGQGGANKLVVHDEAAWAAPGRYILTDGDVRIESEFEGRISTVSYSNIQNLALNTSQDSDIIHLDSTAAGVKAVVDGQGGNDEFLFGDEQSAMNGIRGELTLQGRPGDMDYCMFYAGGETVGHTYRFGASTVTRDGMATVRFSNMYQLGLYAGRGNDTFYIDRMTSGPPLFVSDFGGVDTLIAPRQSNEWIQRGDGSGQLNVGSIANAVHYVGIEQWQGGDLDDYFKLLANQKLTGWIDGRAGRDTLDYSSWTNNLYVNLQTNTNSASAWGVWNIQDVIGGSGNDVLVGDGGNRLVGGAGRDMLIAGRSASVLEGGDGDDLLIAGSTKYDADKAKLQAIATYWSGADNYGTRVSKLQSGNGVLPLNASMVTRNSGANALSGQAARDMFFAALGKDQMADLLNEEVVQALL